MKLSRESICIDIIVGCRIGLCEKYIYTVFLMNFSVWTPKRYNTNINKSSVCNHPTAERFAVWWYDELQARIQEFWSGGGSNLKNPQFQNPRGGPTHVFWRNIISKWQTPGPHPWIRAWIQISVIRKISKVGITPSTQFKPAATWLFSCNLIRHCIYNATILNCLQSPVNAGKVVEAFQYEEAHTKFDRTNGKRTHFQDVIEKKDR